MNTKKHLLLLTAPQIHALDKRILKTWIYKHCSPVKELANGNTNQYDLNTVLTIIKKRLEEVEKNSGMAKSKRLEALRNFKKMESAIEGIIKSILMDEPEEEVA